MNTKKPNFRADIKNPNGKNKGVNPIFKAANDNKSNQLNPNYKKK